MARSTVPCHLLCTHTCSAKQGLTHCSVCPCRTGISCTISCDGGSLFPGSTRRKLCAGLSAQWGGAGWVLSTSLHSCRLWVGLCHMAAAGALRWGGRHQRDGAPEVLLTPCTTGKPDITSKFARHEHPRPVALLLSHMYGGCNQEFAFKHIWGNATLAILASWRGEV